MRFVALGRTEWLYDAIGALTKAGHEVVLIATAPARPEYQRRQEEFAALARQYSCGFFCDEGSDEGRLGQLIQACTPDIGVSINWPTVIGRRILELFPHGIINAHGGDLPRYRGNACQAWAILNGESQVVITLHRMAETLDSGPILLQRPIPLDSGTYIGSVYRAFGEQIPGMFAEVLNRIAAGDIEARAQPEEPQATLRCLPRIPADGEIDWNRPAELLARLVRATAEPYEGAYSFLGLERLTVWRARAEPLPSPLLGVPGQVVERRVDRGEVCALTGNGLLVLEEIELAAKGRARATSLLTSTRTRLGLDVSSALVRLATRPPLDSGSGHR